MKKYLLIITLLTLVLVSCDSKKESALLSEKLNDRNLYEIGKKLTEDPNIDLFDLRYYQKGISNIILSKDSLENKTVKDIIDMQKAKEKAIISNSLLSASQNIEFNLNLGFKLIRIAPADKDDNKMNVITYQFFNNSGQDIKRVKGMVKILSRANNVLIKQFPVDLTEVIPLGKGLQKNLPYLHDDSNQRDQIIRDPKSLLKFEWYPELVVFADDSKIEKVTEEVASN